MVHVFADILELRLILRYDGGTLFSLLIQFLFGFIELLFDTFEFLQSATNNEEERYLWH